MAGLRSLAYKGSRVPIHLRPGFTKQTRSRNCNRRRSYKTHRCPDCGALAFPKRNCGARDASARFTIRTQMTTAGRRPPQNKLWRFHICRYVSAFIHFLRNHAKLPRAYSDLRLRRTLALSRRVSPNVLKMRQIKFDYFGTRGCRSRGSGEFPSKRPTTGTAQCCRACRVTPVLSNRAVAGRREL